MEKYQFVWYRKWQGVHFRKAAWGMALIFDWYLWLGFLEIRQWHDLKDGDIERYNAQSAGQ